MEDNKIVRYDTQTGEPIYYNDKRAYYNAEMDEVNNKKKENYYFAFFSFVIAVALVLAYGKLYNFRFLFNVWEILIIAVSLAFLCSGIGYILKGNKLAKKLYQMENERKNQIGDINSYIVNADNVESAKYIILSSEEIEKAIKKIVKSNIVVSIVILVSMALLIIRDLLVVGKFNYIVAIIFLVALLLYLMKNHRVINKIKKNRFFLRPVNIKTVTDETGNENSSVSINQDKVTTKTTTNFGTMAIFLIVLVIAVLFLKNAGGLYNEAKTAEDGESMFVFIIGILPILPVVLVVGLASILGVFASLFKKK